MKRSRLFLLPTGLLVLGLASVLALTSAQAEPEVVDGIAAQVNNDVITFSQVRDLVGGNERSLRARLSGPELVEKIREARKGALDDLIDRALILQEFKKKEFAIPPSLIEERVNTIIREDFGGDRQAFLRTLQAQGYTMTRFREEERNKVIVQAMRMQNVKSDSIVSPLKIDALYLQNKSDYTTPEQIHLWMIAINKGSGVGPKETDPQKAVADEIRDKISKGGKFEQLATLYSDDQSKRAGGDWGWIDHTTLNEALSNVAFKLEVNKVSPVVSLGQNYYILKVSERKAEYTKPIAEVRNELEKKAMSQERSKLNQQWLAGLRAKAFIKTF